MVDADNKGGMKGAEGDGEGEGEGVTRADASPWEREGAAASGYEERRAEERKRRMRGRERGREGGREGGRERERESVAMPRGRQWARRMWFHAPRST